MGTFAGSASTDSAYYTTTSGSDMTVVIGNAVIGSLQAIAFSAQREKAPLYTMTGSPNPLGFARGKRAIAGTLVFLTFDRTSLLGHMETNPGTAASGGNGLNNNQFYKSKNEAVYAEQSDTKFTVASSNTFGLSNTKENISDIFNDNITSANDLRTVSSVFYADQLMPFDVYITGSNEYGKVIKKAVIGCEILNEGSGVSVDDLVLEEQYTYIARAVTPWEKGIDLKPSGNSPV